MSSPLRNQKRQKVTTKSMKGIYLTMFPQMVQLKEYKTLIFSGNPITSFAGLCASTKLRCLYVDDTEIKSFDGAPELPKLKFLSLKNSPLSRYKKLMLMARIVFENIESVNGFELPARVPAQADRMRELVGPYLRQGWVIISVKPMKLLHTVTRARMTLVLPPAPRPTHETSTIWESPKQDSEDIMYPEQHEEEPLSENIDNSALDDMAASRMNELHDEQNKTLDARNTKNPSNAEIRKKRKQPDPENARSRTMLRKLGGPSDPFRHTKSIAPDHKVFQPKPDFSDLEHVK